ncbi:hypothetical protein D3C72_2543800 [compost metagenome]
MVLPSLSKFVVFTRWLRRPAVTSSLSSRKDIVSTSARLVRVFSAVLGALPGTAGMIGVIGS